ncbi:hypothetical protein O5D80_006025 [Batrachochytrium dendrobatidis]|nr:hypothetical protein O5D80_006025 [Batrachochytrium dendrobatidis]
MKVESSSDTKSQLNSAETTIKSTPFLGSLADSILILIDERKVDDAISLIQVYLDQSSYPQSSTTSKLFALIFHDPKVELHEVAMFVTLYTNLILIHGPEVFDDVWIRPKGSVSTFWIAVEQAWDKLFKAIKLQDEKEIRRMLLIMDLFLDIAMRVITLNDEQCKMREVVIGSIGRRMGLPTGIVEAIDTIQKLSGKSPVKLFTTHLVRFTSLWFNVFGAYKCTNEGMDYHELLSEKAIEIIRSLSNMSISCAAAETLPKSLDAKISRSADKSIDTSLVLNTEWHYHQTLVAFVRTLDPGQFLWQFCDHTLVSTNVYPVTVRHLAKAKPTWQKISQVHLQSKPARVTVGTMWVHAILLSRLMESIELEASQLDIARASIESIIEEIREDLSNAKSRRGGQSKHALDASAFGSKNSDMIQTATIGPAAAKRSIQSCSTIDDDRVYPIDQYMLRWPDMMMMMCESALTL